MMDSFFDAGHIVSNSPILRIEHFEQSSGEKLPPEARRELDEARLGGADFFVVILLNYEDNPQGRPLDILIRIFRTTGGQMVYETKCGSYNGVKAEEEFQQIKQNAVRIVPQLKGRG
jgi:hypothetical protein